MRQRTRSAVGLMLNLGGVLALAHPSGTTSSPPPASRFPLPALVWIQPRSGVHDWRREDVDQAERAFVAWSGITPAIHFRRTDDSAQATVRVWWVDRFLEPVSGESRLVHDLFGRVTEASIALALHHCDGQLLDSNAIRALAMHEVGHLLGLEHSHDAMSIMAPTVHVQTLSSADSARLRRLYTPIIGEP